MALLLMACGAPTPRSVTAHLPSKLDLGYSWVGPSENARQTKIHLALSQNHKVYEVSGETHRSFSTEVKRFTALSPVATTQQVLTLIGKSSWQETAQPAEQVIGKHESINRVLTFYQPNGQTFRLFSTSNTPQGTPWNLDLGEHLYQTQDAPLGQAVLHLLADVGDGKIPPGTQP